MSRAFLIVAVLAVALVLRLSAARYAYPTPGDATHFVQHGIAMANLGLDYMSTYWSQGMIAIASLAVKSGLDPHHVLQMTVLIAGLFAVLFVMLMTQKLSGSFGASIFAGLLAAVLPALVLYSVIGYSEMAYMAFILGAAYFVVCAIHGSALHFLSAAVMGGLSFYFKGADAMVLCAALGVYLLIFHRGKLLRSWKCLALAVLVGGVTVSPLFIITKMRSGSVQPGSKILNLAIGRDWADSKAVYAVEKPWQARADYLNEHGALAFIFKYRGEISTRMVLNSVDYVKIVNDLLFQKTFRMGSGWFLLFAVFMVAMTIRKRLAMTLALPLLCILMPGFIMSLFFFHDRLVVPVLPFYLVVVAIISHAVWIDMRERYAKWLMGATCAGILLFYGAHASGIAPGRTPWWSYYNAAAVAQKLDTYGGEDLRIMASHAGVISVYHYNVNPLVAQPIPFAGLAEIENVAARQNVDLILVSDQYMTHWPVHAVFDERTSLPGGWVLLEDYTIESDDWRVPNDRWLFIGRGAYAAARQTGKSVTNVP